MGTQILGWLNERWPFKTVTHAILTEEIPGGANYYFSLGSSVLFVFIIQAFTGIFQLFYYAPTVDHAYNSVSYLRTEVPFGWLVHGLHYWGAQAMIVLLVLHLSRVYVWGAFKKPREFTWLLGVCLLLFTLGMSFTGAVLPWDVTGYWATEVGTSMAGTVPLIGNFIKEVVRGGTSMGQLALARFFAVHIAILPGLLAGFILFHLVSFRRYGSVGPWQEQKRLTTGPFWPDQLFKDVVVASLVLVILIALSIWPAAPVSGPADPTDLSVQPKPEWNFLFLYQAIKVFKGRLEPVGTVFLPLVAVLFIFLVPFLSKRSERNPIKRPLGTALFLASIAAVIVLTIAGARSHPGQRAAAPVKSELPAVSATAPGTAEGAKLYQSLGCAGCHRIDGAGGATGPDLSGEGNRGRSKQWLDDQIRNPKSHNPQTVMPSFASRIDAGKTSILIDYLMSPKGGTGRPAREPAAAGPLPEKEAPTNATAAPVAPEKETPSAVPASPPQPGPAAVMIGNTGHGEIIFQQTCQVCHGPRGTDKVPNPGSADGAVPPLNPIDREIYNADPKIFAANIDKFIQHGSAPEGQHPALSMPPFGDHKDLTQEAIANVEAYVLALNGVDRAKILKPGIPPALFFLLVTATFVLAGTILAILLMGRRPRAAGGS